MNHRHRSPATTATAATAATTLSRQPVTTPQRLYADWERLCRQPRQLRRVASWGLPGSAPGHLDELLVRAGFGGAHDDRQADQVLHRLVTLAASDDLAARVVLQRILPGLVALSRRRGRLDPGGPRPAFDEAVAAAWMVIRTFPCERRTERIAANLLRDIEYQAFVRGRRLRWAVVEIPAADLVRVSSEGGDPADTVVDDPRRRLDELLAQARTAGLDAATVELLEALGQGRSADELAAEFGITDRSVRGRRTVAIAKLQRLVAA